GKLATVERGAELPLAASDGPTQIFVRLSGWPDLQDTRCHAGLRPERASGFESLGFAEPRPDPQKGIGGVRVAVPRFQRHVRGNGREVEDFRLENPGQTWIFSTFA